MATNKPSRSKSSRSKRRLKPVNEPLPARALQSVILGLGVLLLLGALFGWRWGLILVGLMVLGSAFPPFRRSVDKWLVGKVRGDEANQAAVIRMGLGVLILLLAFFGLG
jgi:hypothetical protein